jgi:hypothetical protein
VRTVGDSTSYWGEWSFAKVLNRISHRNCPEGRSSHSIFLTFLQIFSFSKMASLNTLISSNRVFPIDNKKGNVWKRSLDKAIFLTLRSGPNHTRNTARFFRLFSAHPRGGGTLNDGKGAALISSFYESSNQLTGSVFQISAQIQVRVGEVLKTVHSLEYLFVQFALFRESAPEAEGGDEP